jgi:Fe-Mn family superoxide dismutase
MASSVLLGVNAPCTVLNVRAKLCLTTKKFDPLVKGSRGFQQRRQSLTLRSKRGKLPLASPVSQFVLPDLPYETDALEPHISKQTLEFHWGKHHRAYVDNLNKQIENTDLERNTLDEIVKISYNNGNPSPAFNNAGQAWNHDFYWASMKPGGGGKPEGELLSLIERDFGSYETFLTNFKTAATTQFGSGWAWLVGMLNI